MEPAKTARGRIISAFFELLGDKPYQKITVSALIAAADVNRSTFYRHFENVEDLLECAADETLQKIAVEPPFPVADAASLEQYANVMFAQAQKYHPIVTRLSGEHGDVRVAYRIANAVRDRLLTAANAAGITDANVLRVAGMVSPQLSFYFMAGDIPQTDAAEMPAPEMAFDVSRSMLENVGRLLAKRRGGTDYFHYDLLCAYVKLDAASTESYREIGVSQLLATAGMSRTEFYKYYKNIDDFFEAFENACVYCALYWLMPYFETRTWPDEQALQIFLSKKETRISINKFFIHGRISDYYPKILSLVMRYLGHFIPGEISEDVVMRISFYLSEFAYAICSYLTGLADYASLKQTFDHLQSVRERYGI